MRFIGFVRQLVSSKTGPWDDARISGHQISWGLEWEWWKWCEGWGSWSRSRYSFMIFWMSEFGIWKLSRMRFRFQKQSNEQCSALVGVQLSRQCIVIVHYRIPPVELITTIYFTTCFDKFLNTVPPQAGFGRGFAWKVWMVCLKLTWEDVKQRLRISFFHLSCRSKKWPLEFLPSTGRMSSTCQPLLCWHSWFGLWPCMQVSKSWTVILGRKVLWQAGGGRGVHMTSVYRWLQWIVCFCGFLQRWHQQKL